MRNWFAVVDLHLWMVIQRLRSSESAVQQQQGKRVERELLNTLTQDIERRLREFDVRPFPRLVPPEQTLTFPFDLFFRMRLGGARSTVCSARQRPAVDPLRVESGAGRRVLAA